MVGGGKNEGLQSAAFEKDLQETHFHETLSGWCLSGKGRGGRISFSDEVKA